MTNHAESEQAESQLAESAPVESPPARPRRGPGRWWWVALVSALLGVGAGLAISDAVLPASSSKNLAVSTAGVFQRDHGQPAAAFRVAALRPGQPAIDLAGYRGRPLVLNFWASWCPPCRKEMPAMAAAAKRLAGRIDFVGVDTNDQRGSATAFLKATGVGYPVGFDPAASVAARYGVFGLPTTFFISPSGGLLGSQIGGMTESRLLQLIHQLYPNIR